MQDHLLVQEKKFFITLKTKYLIKILDENPTTEPESEPTSELAPKTKLKPAPDPKVFNTLKQTKAITKHKKFPLNLREGFLNEIVNDETKINDKRFNDYFGYHNPSFWQKIYSKPIQMK